MLSYLTSQISGSTVRLRDREFAGELLKKQIKTKWPNTPEVSRKKITDAVSNYSY